MLACRRAPGSPRKRAGGSARQVLVEPRRVWQTSSGAVDPCLSVPAAVPGKRLRKPKTDGVRGSPFAHGRRLIGGGASSEELLSGGVQRQQDPDRGQHDHRRDEVLGVGGDRRPEDQRGDYEEGLLDPCDLPLGTTELHEQPRRQDDSDENAVAEIGDGPGDAFHVLEPGEHEGRQPEEGDTEDRSEDRTHTLNAIRQKREREARAAFADLLAYGFTEVRRPARARWPTASGGAGSRSPCSP